MTRDFNAVDTEHGDSVLQSAYYKKLQKELKERTSSQQSQQQRHQEESLVKKAEPVQKSAPSLKNTLKQFEDTVQVSSFAWQDTEGDPHLTSQASPSPLSAVNLHTDETPIFRMFGIKIDFSSKVTQLQQQFMQLVVQSRSSNFFIGKFAQFKLGVVSQLLGYIGVSLDIMEGLKQKAIAGAVSENIHLMSENIYSLELTELLHGTSKKTKKTISMFREVERQLMAQMVALGKPDYWKPIRLSEERLRQCKRIQDEFNKDYHDLSYQLDFYRMRG